MTYYETTYMAIPKKIYLYWQGSMPCIVSFCIDRIRDIHDDEWSVTLLDGESWVEPVENFEELSLQHKSDWIRMCALQNGGVWLDASCICTAPVDHWVDMYADAVQGFSDPFSETSLENWAFAAPPESRLMVRWKDIFRKAIVLGFDSFKKQVPQYIREHAVFDRMPYLTMHACFLMAVHDTGEHALLSPSSEGPFRYICENEWISYEAVKTLMHHPMSNVPPLIKLRSGERKLFDSIECHEGSFMNSLGVPVSPSKTGEFTHLRVNGRVVILIILSAVVLILVIARAVSSRTYSIGMGHYKKR